MEVSDEDHQKTAFCTTEGLYKFKVIPFRLCNAPVTFHRLMDLILAGLQWTSCLVYLSVSCGISIESLKNKKNFNLILWYKGIIIQKYVLIDVKEMNYYRKINK